MLKQCEVVVVDCVLLCLCMLVSAYLIAAVTVHS